MPAGYEDWPVDIYEMLTNYGEVICHNTKDPLLNLFLDLGDESTEQLVLNQREVESIAKK